MARAPVAATFTLDQARSAWAHGLGLHGQGEDPVAAAGACGWARSLGGAAAYLTLKARAGQVRAASISDPLRSPRVRLPPAARPAPSCRQNTRRWNPGPSRVLPRYPRHSAVPHQHQWSPRGPLPPHL